MGSVNYLQAIKPDTAYLRKVIENSLLADWIIRIEYENKEHGSEDWQQWDKTFFALQSAEPVLVALKDCYSKNLNSAIRINAEKFRPQTRMLYQVYNPGLSPAVTDFKPQLSSQPHPGNQNKSLSRVELNSQNQ